MVKKGNLEAILLTGNFHSSDSEYNNNSLLHETLKYSCYSGFDPGMTPQAFPLLQKYLDMTADVQTVAILVIRTMAMDISNSSLLKLWTERYRLHKNYFTGFM